MHTRYPSRLYPSGCSLCLRSISSRLSHTAGYRGKCKQLRHQAALAHTHWGEDELAATCQTSRPSSTRRHAEGQGEHTASSAPWTASPNIAQSAPAGHCGLAHWPPRLPPPLQLHPHPHSIRAASPSFVMEGRTPGGGFSASKRQFAPLVAPVSTRPRPPLPSLPGLTFQGNPKCGGGIHLPRTVVALVCAWRECSSRRRISLVGFALLTSARSGVCARDEKEAVVVVQTGVPLDAACGCRQPLLFLARVHIGSNVISMPSQCKRMVCWLNEQVEQLQLHACRVRLQQVRSNVEQG